VQKSIEIKFC